MTETVKIFIENNIDLIDKYVEVFINRASQQLYDLETRELIDVLNTADINILDDVETFLRKYITGSIYLFDGVLLDDVVNDIPPFHKTKYELHDLICEVAKEEGYDIVCNNYNDEYLEKRI